VKASTTCRTGHLDPLRLMVGLVEFFRARPSGRVSGLYFPVGASDGGTLESRPRPRRRYRYGWRHEPGALLIAPNPAPDEHELNLGATPWRQFAMCLGHEPDLWFPIDSDGGARAVSICSVCPVRLDCLAWAIEHNERNGIWGGVSARKRQRIRAELRRTHGSVSVPIALAASLRLRDVQAIRHNSNGGIQAVGVPSHLSLAVTTADRRKASETTESSLTAITPWDVSPTS
jgi:WhiB family redox-sensing transcriptional regulator